MARVQPLLARYGYGAAFAAVMVEGMGIPAPGQTLLMAGALEAAAGRMNIVLLLFVVALAAVFGNSVGYAIGRWGGRAALNKLGSTRSASSISTIFSDGAAAWSFCWLDFSMA